MNNRFCEEEKTHLKHLEGQAGHFYEMWTVYCYACLDNKFQIFIFATDETAKGH